MNRNLTQGLTKNFLLFLATGLPLAIAGCGGDSGPQKYPVSGKVTYAGTVVNDGSMTLTPADGNGPSATLLIKAGVYEGEATAGRKLVEINGNIPIEGKFFDMEDGTKVPATENLPAKYNEESELSLEVSSKGDNKVDFDLEP